MFFFVVLWLMLFSLAPAFAADSDCEIRYQEGFNEGAQQCKDDPASCGITISDGDINSDGKIGLEDIIYGLQIISGYRLEPSCDSCECETYAENHRCECNETYANSHLEECGLTFKTLVGTWNYKVIDPNDLNS